MLQSSDFKLMMTSVEIDSTRFKICMQIVLKMYANSKWNSSIFKYINFVSTTCRRFFSRKPYQILYWRLNVPHKWLNLRRTDWLIYCIPCTCMLNWRLNSRSDISAEPLSATTVELFINVSSKKTNLSSLLGCQLPSSTLIKQVFIIIKKLNSF